jgi:hypothetical protein
MNSLILYGGQLWLSFAETVIGCRSSAFTRLALNLLALITNMAGPLLATTSGSPNGLVVIDGDAIRVFDLRCVVADYPLFSYRLISQKKNSQQPDGLSVAVSLMVCFCLTTGMGHLRGPISFDPRRTSRLRRALPLLRRTKVLAQRQT